MPRYDVVGIPLAENHIGVTVEARHMKVIPKKAPKTTFPCWRKQVEVLVNHQSIKADEIQETCYREPTLFFLNSKNPK